MVLRVDAEIVPQAKRGVKNVVAHVPETSCTVHTLHGHGLIELNIPRMDINTESWVVIAMSTVWNSEPFRLPTDETL